MLDLDGKMPTSRRCESASYCRRPLLLLYMYDGLWVCKTQELPIIIMSRDCNITHSEFIFVDRLQIVLFSRNLLTAKNVNENTAQFFVVSVVMLTGAP